MILKQNCKIIEKDDIIQQKAQFKEEDVKQFAEIMPGKPKLDNSFVQQMLVGSLFSKVIGNCLPSSIYLKQGFVFKKKVKQGDELIVRVTVKDIDSKKKRLELVTQVWTEGNKELVVDGSASILYEQLEVPPQ